MKHFIPLTALLFLSGTLLAQEVPTKQTSVTIPPLSVSRDAQYGAPAGDWKAPNQELPYAETKANAEKAEKEGDVAAALTLWERVIDRTSCTEEQRAEARKRVGALRPMVRFNTDPDQAKPWHVLVLVYKEVKFDRIAKEQDGSEKKEPVHKFMTDDDMKRIGNQLAGFRDMLFEWSSGIVIPVMDVVVIEKPVTKDLPKEFLKPPHEALPDFQEACGKYNRQYDSVIAYVKSRGNVGPRVGPHYVAAMYGRLGRDYGGAGFMMVPWGPDYPFRHERVGEMEVHEWTHQLEDVVKHLGYHGGIAENPDHGREYGQEGGDIDYRRPKGMTTWSLFYKHIMTEHLTRQIWSELSVRETDKPGKVITEVK